jgi:signal peptide peptidase SppA
MPRITDFAVGAAWAIVPERFEAIAAKFDAAQITDEMILKAEAEGALVLKNADEEKSAPYRVTDDGVAIVPVSGPLVKDSFLAWLFDGTTFAQIRAAVERAANDEEVVGIVLDVDSPGGTVNGTEETAEAIFAVRGEKPIAAFSSGMMASAAYWIGSAAQRVIVGKTAEAGSIGVLMVHREISALEQRIGIKTTYLRAGKFKAIGNPSEPLTETAREIFQSQLDQLYSLFVGSVALHRDAEDEKVRTDMADGRLFIGNAAVGAGIADQVGNLQAAVDWVLSAVDQQNQNRRRFIPMSGKTIEIKTYDELAAIGGDVLKSAEEKAFKTGADSVDLAGAETRSRDGERGRVLGLASAFLGDEDGAQFAAIVNSGITVDQFKAVSGAKRQKAVEDDKQKMLQSIIDAGAENPGAGGGGSAERDFFALVDAVQAEKKISRYQALQEVTRKHPDARRRMLEQNNPRLRAVK